MTQLRNVTCHMESHSVACYPTQVNTPRLNPSHTIQAGTRFTYPRGMEGWVDLVDLIAARPGVEPATFRSRVRRSTTAPPRQPNNVRCLQETNRTFFELVDLLCTERGPVALQFALESQSHLFISFTYVTCFCSSMTCCWTVTARTASHAAICAVVISNTDLNNPINPLYSKTGLYTVSSYRKLCLRNKAIFLRYIVVGLIKHL